MYILGISSLAHDPAAALLGENGIVAAFEEGKLLRQRHCQGIPREAISYCLAKAGIGWQQVANVAVASRPVRTWARQVLFRTRTTLRSPVSSGYYQSKALGELARELNNLRILNLLEGAPHRNLLQFDHASCHAASAFYASPFDRALILSLDEMGNGRCGLAALGVGSEIRELHSVRFPHSLPWVYTQVTELLGFTPRSDEHKTQWLAVKGEPVFQNLFLEMFRSKKGAWPHLNPKFFRRGYSGQLAFSDEFYRRLKSPRPAAGPIEESVRANLAASVQSACTTVVLEILERLRQETGLKNLCLAGGQFLNSLIVAAVEKQGGFDEVFVQPAAGNEGTALGAAWLAWHSAKKKPRMAPTLRLDWGPSFSNQEIKQVLDNCKASYRWTDPDDHKIAAAIGLLEAGKIVAWFQGAAEFGPRALGNRSLLASPWAPYVKENLNDFVKHRESYRPFALSIPEEDASRFFECSPAGRFMATMGLVRSEHRETFRDFLLPDGQLRLHLVAPSANPLLWKLLKRFGQTSPAPVVVNTSFNLFGEPLVVTPRDALRSYFCSGADALVIGSFLLTKS